MILRYEQTDTRSAVCVVAVFMIEICFFNVEINEVKSFMRINYCQKRNRRRRRIQPIY